MAPKIIGTLSVQGRVLDENNQSIKSLSNIHQKSIKNPSRINQKTIKNHQQSVPQSEAQKKQETN